MAPDPDRGSLIVGVGHSLLRIDPLGGHPAETLFTALDTIRDLATAPDGSWCAAADERGFAYVQDGTSVEALGQGPAFSNTFRGLLATTPFAVEPSNGLGNQAQRWDTAASRPLAVAPDGRRLATAGPGNRVHLWDVASRTTPAQTLESPDATCSVAFSPGGDFLLTADTQGDVRRWDLTGHGATRMRSQQSSTLFTRNPGTVTVLAVAPCGTWCAGGDTDGLVRLWNLPDGRCRAVLTGHTDAVVDVVIAPDDSWLATTGRDGVARLWEIPPERPVAPVDAGTRPVATVAYTPDGACIAAAHGNEPSAAVRFYGAEDGITALRLDNDEGGNGQQKLLAFTPDGSWLASARHAGVGGGSILVWDLAARCVKVSLYERDSRVSALAAAPDGSWLAGASYDGKVRLWDPESGDLQAVLSCDGPVCSVAVSPDGTWLASGGSDGAVAVWGLATHTRTIQLTGGKGAVLALSVSPDGRWLFGAGEDGTLRLWNPRTGDYRGLRTGNGQPLHAVAASPDGRWIATAGEDGTVRVWDRRGGQVVAAQRTEGPLRSCSWRPDSGALAVGGDRGLYAYRFRLG
ncbi:WD40 repeat domain-containing protein [Streptomyces sp. NPDC054864]